MLLTNTTPYAKNYRVLAMDKVKLIISGVIVIIKVSFISSAYIVYKAGILKGIVTICDAGQIFAICEYQRVGSVSCSWSINSISGVRIPKHKLPYYCDQDTTSFYGFKVTQPRNLFNRQGAKLDANLRSRCAYN